MKCPDLQKQALLTIHSICENREDNVDLLREMGGVVFVYNLSKSSIVHSDVKETALFTLCTLAEANVYCKNSLCRKETFADLAGWLMKEDIPLTQKRVSVYLLSVLVASNKSGQTLAQTTGCLDILLDLFRTTFPLSTNATSIVANVTHTYQFWASVSSALCGCVNNPQNEEGQHICVAAFPTIKIWLQQIALPHTQIFQSVCSFIAMTVANNSCVQESFSVSGGLETLTFSLVRLASVADTSVLSCQLSVTLSKTLSACIADNPALASGLAQYGIVPQLFSLLGSPNLDPKDRLSVLLALGHCTEASEEHQSQLVQCGGLPLIITLLTEDTSEAVRRASTFILQTCKQATMSLGMPGLIAKHGENENAEPLTNMESFRNSARELLRRIDQLEKKQAKEAEDEQENKDIPTSTEGLVLPSLSPTLPLPLQHKENIKTIPTAYRQTSTHKRIEAGDDNNFKLQTDQEMSKITAEEHLLSHSRCAGCVLPFEKVTSRTFASLQSSCPHSCDMHRALQTATEQFRTRHCSLLFRREFQDNTVELTEVSLTPICKGAGKVMHSLPEQHSKKHNGFTLTPLRRGAKKETFTSYNKTERRGENSGHRVDKLKTSTDHCSTRKKRNDFSVEEVRYLLSGVKTFGFSWNSILWSYPFQPGRTNVDLAKKYKRLTRGKSQDAGYA
ncbi:telomere repeats-binding bouquet formation protein 1 [Lates japonicus]|uniref:Telomere repeats-binding bouquet formation protein 1 n=1 Tax=Lates japonicus TaxID=270547 RepID=A0AAD3MVL9_LATJO|nr:telomere repeats-binding bouquet formation protein 1 [Lates japonicus]